MKKIFPLLSIAFASFTASAQSGWHITSGRSVVNIKTMGDESAPVDIKLPLTVTFNPSSENYELRRSIMISEDGGNELERFEWKADKGSTVISAGELAKYFEGRSKIILYTMAVPKDPAKAALVKVRRIQVCILTKSETSLQPKIIKKKKKVKHKKKNS